MHLCTGRHWFIAYVVSVFTCAYITDYFAVYLIWHIGAEWITVIGLAEALFFTITATVICSCSVSHQLHHPPFRWSHAIVGGLLCMGQLFRTSGGGDVAIGGLVKVKVIMIRRCPLPLVK